MMGKSHFLLLSYLIGESEQETSISTLAEGLNWSVGHTSRVVSGLEANGCVRTTETGRQKLVSTAEIEPIEQLENLMAEYSHVDFPNLVAGSGLQLLYYLDRRRTATEIAELSNISRATAYRRLDDLQAVGIVGKSGSHYQLNDPFSVLSSIARGVAHHEHRSEAERYADRPNIIWETHGEYLFACDSECSADKFCLTGPSLFIEFNIPLLTRDRRHYLRSDRLTRIPPAELVCHTLLINDGTRYRTYSLLLIQSEKIEEESLRECAEYYNLEADSDLVAIVNELLEYMKTEGKVTTTRLPTWEDFKSTAADYDIIV